MKTKQFILLGPPGIDVRAQGVALAERWQVPHVSMEKLLREALPQTPTIGTEVSTHGEADELVPDALVMKLMRRRFEQPDAMLKGWVLDGFPRTLAQAQAFDEWLLTVGKPTATVAYLKAMTGVLLNRLWSKQGQNESLVMIRQRLAQHQEDVAPLLEYYQQRSRLKTVNASLSFAEVSSELAQLGNEAPGAARFIKDETELNTLLTGSDSLLVVDCMASWCGSCKLVAPMIDKLADTYRDRINVMKIDFDANQQIAKRFGLKGMPAVMFFKDGELQETLTGVKSYQTYSATVTSLLETCHSTTR